MPHNDSWELAPILAFIAAVIAVVGVAFLLAIGDRPLTTAKAPQTNSGPSDTSSRPKPAPSPSPAPNQ